MKKRVFLIAFFSAMMFTIRAQIAKSPKNPTDILFIGHVIHVFKVGNGYGYDISYQNRLLVHQASNPFLSGSNGLKNQEDAVKVAKWQIIHFRHPGTEPTPDEKTIPLRVASQLNINTN